MFKTALPLGSATKKSDGRFWSKIYETPPALLNKGVKLKDTAVCKHGNVDK
jgi:hypothetical protein